MGHEELKEIGINAYGHRHKLIKGMERLLGGQQGGWEVLAVSVSLTGRKNERWWRADWEIDDGTYPCS